MTKRYYQFSKKHFEYGVRNFLIENRLGFLTDITQDYIAEGGETWERIYKISTRNRAVDIIVFSSVDMRTNHVREHGDDAVRLVMRWKTRNGYVYKRLAKHLRISTLFNNMHKTVSKAQQSVFNLSYGDFSKEVK